MKITQDEVVERQTVLHIELEEDDLDPYLDRGYRRVVQRVNIPGFRKGKAPRTIIESYLGRESILNEAVEFMVPDVTQRAISAQNLETAGHPKLELEDLNPVKVKATVALSPTVDLGPFRSIRVQEEKIETTEDDIQERLSQMRKEAATWEPVDQPVTLGNMVTMSVTGSIEDNEILNEKDAVYIAEEGGVLPFPGFSEKLKGAPIGSPIEFDLNITDDFPDASVAGKNIHFSLIVSDVKEQTLPELDDEFAKSVGDGFENLEAMRKSVESEINLQADEAQATKFQEAVLDELLKTGTIELPPLLIDHEIEHMVERRDRFAQSLNMSTDDYLKITGKTQEDIEGEMREQAVARFSRSYALAKLAETEGLEVPESEIDQRIKDLKDADDDKAGNPNNVNLDSEEAKASIKETLLMRKAIDRLTAIAKGEATDSVTRGAEPIRDEKNEQDGGKTDATES